MASFIIASMALVPGLPKIPFLLLGACSALLGRIVARSEKDLKQKRCAAPRPKPEK